MRTLSGVPVGSSGRGAARGPSLPALPTLPTPQLIYMHWMNTVVNYCGPFEYEVGYCEKLKSFLEANLEWMQEELELSRDSAYWHQVGAAALPGAIGRGLGLLRGPATAVAAAAPAGGSPVSRPSCPALWCARYLHPS